MIWVLVLWNLGFGFSSIAVSSEFIGVYLWLLREKYLPAVLAAFGPHDPTEAQFGAALSFHWNTGATTKADLVPQELIAF